MRLQGKVALITGAGRGIGRAITELFSREGAKVVINYSKSEKEATELAAIIRNRGGEALALKADVSKCDEVRRMVQATVEKFGRIDILVNNAGIMISTKFPESTEDAWNKTIGVNLKGVYLCSREVAAIMLKQKRGKIVNISSISGLAERTAIMNVPYAASKAGVIGLTRSLALNLGPNVNVNGLCPGWTDTDMSTQHSSEWKRFVTDQTILKRTGKPEEIAYGALFLASDESDFITGELLTVSGGRGMR